MHRYEELGESGAAWINDPKNELAAVFVHGWGGDYKETWTSRPPLWKRCVSRTARRQSVLLFDLLTPDESLHWDYYSLRHAAGPLSRVEIDRVAGLVRLFIESYAAGKAIALVAHSLGGLACRQATLELLNVLQGSDLNIIGLLLFGTPNTGTQLARYARRLWSRSAEQMEPLSGYLADLNREWAQRIINGGDPRIQQEQRSDLICWNVIGEKDRIVPPQSAASLSYLGDIKTLPKSHTGLPKATSNRDSPVVVLKDFLKAATIAIAEKRIRMAANQLASERRHSVLTNGWVEEEEEHIVLTDLGKPDRFQCQIVHTRTGWVAQRRFRIIIRVEDLAPPREAFDYDCLIGRGLLTGDEFARLASRTSSPSQFLQYLSVERLRVTQDGDTYDYIPEGDPLHGMGWVVLTCCCTSVREGVPSERLELQVGTFVARNCGWYYYYSPRTVLKKLLVDLTAPFPLLCRARLGPRTALSLPVPTPNGDYTSQASAIGPVACGSSIDWMFLKGGKYGGDKEGSAKESDRQESDRQGS